MKTQHTPGPWQESGVSIHTRSGRSICLMYYEHVRYGVPARDGIREEDEANARLIAAAPELLHACKLIATWFKREKDGPNYEGLTRDTHPRGEEIWGEWWNRNLDLREETQVAAFAAIAKAEASRTEGRTEGVRS